MPAPVGSSRHSHYRILDLKGAYEYFTLVQFFKVLRGGNHDYLLDKVTAEQHVHVHDTRFRFYGKLVLAFYKK